VTRNVFTYDIFFYDNGRTTSHRDQLQGSLNRVAYPSNHLDAYRALDNPRFILLDEADFFRKSEQEDVRHVPLYPYRWFSSCFR
jgi:hypothetical protein